MSSKKLCYCFQAPLSVQFAKLTTEFNLIPPVKKIHPSYFIIGSHVWAKLITEIYLFPPTYFKLLLCHSLFQGGSTDPAPPSPTQTLEPLTEKTVKKKPSFKSKLKLYTIILRNSSIYTTCLFNSIFV